MDRRQLRAAALSSLSMLVLTACGPVGTPAPSSVSSSAHPSGDPTPRETRVERISSALADSCPQLERPSSGSTAPGQLSWLTPDPGQSPQDALDAAVEGAQKDLGITVSMAVRDRAAGDVVAVDPERAYPAASLSKIPVAMTRLRLLASQGPLSETLTDDERLLLLEEAIIRSDNDAAEALYLAGGTTPAERQAALRETHRLLGSGIGADGAMPGLDPTTAQEQLLILDALQDPPEWLGAESAALITELMAVDPAAVDESQDFGVGSLATPPDPVAADVRVKNGWIPVDAGHGAEPSGSAGAVWSAGTTGTVSVEGAPLDLTVLLDGAETTECTFAALDAMAEVGMQTART